MWRWSSIKGICRAFSLDYFGHKFVCEIFFLCQRVNKRGWWEGRFVGCLSTLYTRYKFRSLQPVSRLSQFVFVFLGGRGVGRGLVGLEKTIESSRSFNYSRAFTHISKYESVDSETESVFTLDSTFKISRRDQTGTCVCVCVCVCFFLSFFFFFSRFTIYIRGRERLRGRDLT